MSYCYETELPGLLTRENIPKLIHNRDRVLKLLDEAGAIRMGKAMAAMGTSWKMMAAVDYLVELGDIREIDQGDTAGQNRIFVRKSS